MRKLVSPSISFVSQDNGNGIGHSELSSAASEQIINGQLYLPIICAVAAPASPPYGPVLLFTWKGVHPYSFQILVARSLQPVSYTHLRAHETRHDLVCRLLLEK